MNYRSLALLLATTVLGVAPLFSAGVALAEEVETGWSCPDTFTTYSTLNECRDVCVSNCVAKFDQSPPATSPTERPHNLLPAQNSPTVPAPTQQRTTGGVSGGGTDDVLLNPLGPGIATLPDLLVSILDFIVQVGSLVVVVMLIYIGFLFVKAQGNPTELTTAKRALGYTIAGALILLGSKVIAAGIAATVQALATGQ